MEAFSNPSSDHPGAGGQVEKGHEGGHHALGCSEKSRSVIKKKEHTYFGVVGYTNKEFQVKI